MDTLQQIAAAVGVSPNTVRRVLRGENKEVWPGAIRRGEAIRTAARKLGFLPNGSARAMRTGRFGSVALVLSTDRGRSYLPDDLLIGIHDALARRRLRLIVCRVSDKDLTNSRLMPMVLQEWSCDGLLIDYTDREPRQLVRLLGKYRTPSIWINHKQAADCVCYDDEGGAAAATRHLLALGHQRIAYLDFVEKARWPLVHTSRRDRYAGYARAMREAGLRPTLPSAFGGVPKPQRLEATVHLLRRPDRPTALLGYDAGIRLLHAATLAGLRVPRDVSIMAFGPQAQSAAIDEEEFLGRRIGTMGLPVEQAGQQAVELLQRKMAAPERKVPACVLPLIFDPGDTCGPAPVAGTRGAVEISGKAG